MKRIVVTLLGACFYLGISAQLTFGLPKAVLYDKAGRSVSTASISDFDNPIIVVPYSTSWCEECVDFIDDLDDEYVFFAGTQVKIIAINVESGISTSKVFDHARRWKHVEVLNDRDNVFLKATITNYLPKIFFMDGNQQVVYSHTQSSTMDSKKAYQLVNQIKRKEVTAEKIYYDKNWLPCPANEAVYYRTISKKSNGNWLVNDYYKSGKLQMTGEALMIAPIVKQGKYSYYFENGNLSSEANYNKDIYEGSYKGYHENGNLRSEYSYENQKIEGSYKVYHENGKKAIEGKVENGLFEGTVTYYYDNGKKRKVAVYSNGNLNGKCSGWYADGKSKFEAYFKNDELMKDPLPFYYHNNGVRAMEIKKDANGKELVNYFYEDGKTWFVIEFVDDLLEFTEYYSNGKPGIKATMRDSKTVNGKYIAWYENGQKKFETTYFNNKPTGKAMAWYSNGKPKEKIDYDTDITEYFDEAGNKTSSLKEYILKVKKGQTLSTEYLLQYTDMLSRIIKD